MEAACRDVLYVARAAEQHAGQQLSPQDYTRALVESLMGSDVVGFFVEAMTLTRRRQDLAPLVERTVERLHAEGLRAYAAEVAARGWHSRLDPETSARRFWAIAIGVTLEGHAMGRSPDQLTAEMLRLLGPQADASPASKRLSLVGAGSSIDSSPAEFCCRQGEPAMTALRIRARELMTEQELIQVRARVDLEEHCPDRACMGLDLGSIAMVAVWPNPFTFILAVALIGSRQLGLAILMHDGAHGCLANGERLNMPLSQWFCAYPIFAETVAYRRYHLQHHARTQQDDDPDLILSAPFPITRPSYRRNSGAISAARPAIATQGAVSQCARRSVMAAGAAGYAISGTGSAPQLVANWFSSRVAAAGVWWASPLLWLLPLLTWMMVITRIRNIAEHAVVPDSDDPLRNTRTTARGFIEALFIAPYYVNYHLEHHLLSTCPATTCPAFTDPLARPSCRADGGAAELCRRCGWRPRSPPMKTGPARW